MVVQVSCTVPIAKNLFRGQPFEGINFSDWKGGNANIPLLAVPRILTTIPPTVTSHTCMVSTGCPFFFVIFSLLYMLTQIVVFRQTMADDPNTFSLFSRNDFATKSGVLFQKNDDLFGRIAVDPPHCIP